MPRRDTSLSKSVNHVPLFPNGPVWFFRAGRGLRTTAGARGFRHSGYAGNAAGCDVANAVFGGTAQTGGIGTGRAGGPEPAWIAEALPARRRRTHGFLAAPSGRDCEGFPGGKSQP